MKAALPQDEAKKLLAAFLEEREHERRYASFDYCFGYFQSFRRQGRLMRLVEGDNLRRSCVELGFYLASWGMLRGSSDLLNKSIYFLRPLVQAIASAPPEVWDLDVDKYGDSPWDGIFKRERKRIVDALGNLRNKDSQILVTKIMLGVYGNVPAFDEYFTAGLNVSTFGPNALGLVRDYYAENKSWLDSVEVRVLGFSGDEPQLVYPKAKLIDMIFFMKGLEDSRRGSTPPPDGEAAAKKG